MSGHNKWSSIKHKKGKEDAKRGKIFSKIIKEITVAARMGGGDPDINPRLRNAIDKAKAANMPSKNIENAIKKGTGELPGVNYEESTYEGYGPGGVAILMEVLTDNKNRSLSEIRHLFTRADSSLSEPGAVSWMFAKQGQIRVSKNITDEDTLMDIVLDAGAEDMQDEDDMFLILTDTQSFEDVKKAIEKNDIAIENAEITQIASNTIKLEGDTAKKFFRLLMSLEDHEDISNLYSNFEMDDELLEQLVSEM